MLEAMKMEMQVVAPFSGRVRKVLTMPNVQVDTGAPLLQIEPDSGDGAVAETARIDFAVKTAERSTRWRSANPVAAAAWKIFVSSCSGFDIDPKDSTKLLTQWGQTCPVDSDDIRQAEDEILSIFVDVCTLFQRSREVNDVASSQEPTAETYLFAYLRMLDTRGEGLPDSLRQFAEAGTIALRRCHSRPLAPTGRDSAVDLQITSADGAADCADYRNS